MILSLRESNWLRERGFVAFFSTSYLHFLTDCYKAKQIDGSDQNWLDRLITVISETV
jgi:hypothetical protein